MNLFGKKSTVLIVEDDESTLQLLQFYVHWAGYKTVLARNGREALAMVEAEPPALAVVDIMLPEVHGIAVCHSIKTNPKTQKVPVLVVSVKNFPADHNQVKEAGADLFLAKPLEEKDFVAAIHKLIKDK